MSVRQIALFLLVGIVSVLGALFWGGETISWAELSSAGSVSSQIVWDLRLPRLLLVFFAGGALAVLGATYQILFHNPLAEPYVLGVSSAVTLGIATGEIVFGIPAYSIFGTAAGLVAALLVTLTLVWISVQRLGEGLDRVVLFGMGINFVLSSALFLMLSYVYQHMGGGSMRWLFGQIPWVSGKEALVFCAGCTPFLVAVWAFGRNLDALTLGDSVARTLGVSPERMRPLLLCLTSALLALVVCFTGSVGFVGLVVPHAARMMFRPPSSRILLSQTFLLGAIFLVLADTLSRALLPPMEFPIGIITTLFGGPIFLWLLWKR